MRQELASLQSDWDALASEDALWAVLTEPGTRGGKWDVEAFFERGRAEVAWVLNRLKLETGFDTSRIGGSVLDFGCGVGRLSQALAERFESVVGVDISEHMLAKAAGFNRHGERVRYVLNVSDGLSVLGDARFDLIYSSITLQHMPAAMQLRYVGELAGRLNADGLLVFGVVTRLGGGGGSAARRWVRQVLPQGLRYRVNRLRGRVSGDRLAGRMQMHAVPMSQVESALRYAGARVRAVWPSNAAGEGYECAVVVAGLIGDRIG